MGRARRVLPHLVSFATGTLLGAALLALLPEALESAGTGRRARHRPRARRAASARSSCSRSWCSGGTRTRSEYADHGAHHHHHEHREQASALLVLVGDSIHNALDGVLIGAAFLTDVKLGIVTAHCRDGARNPAGNRRLRRAAELGHVARPGAAPEPAQQPHVGGRRRGRLLRAGQRA